MKFINRKYELERLKEVVSSDIATLTIIYGRRRSGKSRLITEMLTKDDLYFMADQSESARQIELFAQQISLIIPDFDRLHYPNWESLFENLNYRVKEHTIICIDEFPYLVKNAQELPSILQKIWENKSSLKYHLILCGSSQQLMHGLVFNASAPLYGRADEILKIKPLSPPFLQDVLNCSASDTITEYSIWGGIPRYWELRQKEKSLWQALGKNVFTSQGILYDEPLHLFLDDMRETVQSFTLLSLIASGSHRLSEIAARIEKPATHLSGPLNKLLMLGYLNREIPFGEHKRNSKKSLYKIADPYLNFYFSFIVPYRSLIEIEKTATVKELVKRKLQQYVSNYWEEICRQAIPFINLKGASFKPASRWWGSPKKGIEMELDVVAESIDNKYLLIGECKWSEKKVNSKEWENKIRKKASLLLFSKNKTILPVLFLKNKTGMNEKHIFDPQDILNGMR